LPGSQLSAVLSGTGDADLYVRFGSRPSTSNWDCRPYSETAAEQCVLTVPANATTVYVDVRGYTASTYSLQIQRVAEAGSGGTGGSGGAGGSAGAGGSGQGNEPFVIAVLGSSTAEGEGASSMANSWVGLLESSLSSTANVSITNLAVGGYTTLELMSGSGASGSIDAALQEHPDLVVVALAGSNDQSMGTSGASYLSRLGQLRDKARAAGVPTFFVGTAPKDLSDGERFELADWNQQMRTSFSSCWVPASASYSPCFIDIFSQLADSDLQIRAQYEGGDGIHLNDAGHRVIFSQAVAVIEPYLCTVMDCR
jgi:lysophospholipase L1-like esterase